jgi:hypothetical protein
MPARASPQGGARRRLTGAAALLLLVGCGGPSVVATGVIPDAAGSGSASTIAATVSGGRSPVTGSIPGRTSPTPGTGAANSAFCQDLSEQLATLPNLLGQLGSADQRDIVLQQIKAAGAKLVLDAPPEVRADARTIAGVIDRIIADASANPPNLDDVSKAIADPAYLQASNDIGTYAGQHCGSLTAP